MDHHELGAASGAAVGPIFNKHDGFRASLIMIVATTKTGETEYYIAPPAELEKLLIPRARALADRPKRDGKQRSIAFRKELPREVLKPWLNAWQQLGERKQRSIENARLPTTHTAARQTVGGAPL